MKQWFWKRWVWAVVVGATAAISFTPAQPGGDAPSGPPKVGDVITLKFRDSPDRQVKVLKSERQPDGSYLSEVKDAKTGETFTLMDRFDNVPRGTEISGKAVPGKAAPKAVESTRTSESPKPGDAPKAKPRSTDPLTPALKDTMPDSEKEKAKEQERERRILSSFTKSGSTNGQEEERPGLLKRLFGKKSPPPTPQVSPVPTTSAKPAAPAVSVPSKSVPPASATPPVVTVPAAPPPPAIRPSTLGVVPPSGVTAEPPRSQPVQPVAPPTPAIPVPVAPPIGPAAPSLPIPVAPPAANPVPLPAIPNVPPIAVPSTPGGLPSIPIPQQMSVGSDLKPPLPPVVQTAATAPEPKISPAAETHAVQMTEVSVVMRELQPMLAELESGSAPSKRATAARCLAGGRHGSTDEVKAALFRAAQSDGSGMVRAVCIEELCKLGYYDSAFMAYLTKATTDTNEEVRNAAKIATTRMTPRK